MAATLDDLLRELQAIRSASTGRPTGPARGGPTPAPGGLTDPADIEKYEETLKRIDLLMSKNPEYLKETRKLEQQNIKLLEKREALENAIASGDTDRQNRAEQDLLNLEKQIEKQEEFVDNLAKAEDISKDLANSFGSLFSGKAPDLKGMLDPKNIQGLAKNFKSLTDAKMLTQAASKAAVAALFEYSKAAINLAIDLGDMETQFMKATGANQEFARSVTMAYEETRTFGASAEETSAAAQTLFNSFTDFTLVSGKARENLIETSAVMARLGVSNQDFAKSIQTSTKAMGMSSDQAAQNMLNLEKFAENLGVAPQQLAADFAGAGDMLAKMGQQGTKAFKDLAIVAKTTGMQMESILAITNKFDTFEGAADQAGKLNAALGGNFVNAMDLMMATDPAERFGMIRDSILDAGLSFDEMSYYQKNFYKESLGLSDVGELAALMSGDMDLVAGATQDSAQSMIDAKKRAQEMATFQERLNMAFAQMIPIITPLIDALSDVTLFITNNMNVIKPMIGVLITLASVIALVSGVGTAGGVAGLGLGLGILFDSIRVGNDKVSVLNILFEEIKSVFDILFEPVSQIFDAFQGLFSLMGEGAGEAEPLLHIVKFMAKMLGRSLMLALAPLMFSVRVINVVVQTIRTIYRLLAGEPDPFGPFVDSLKAFGQIAFKILDPFIYVIYHVADALKSAFPAFGMITDAIDSIANFLFEKQYASNFLEGIVKLANAFSSMAVGMAENLNPFTAMSKLVDSIGNAFTGIIGAVSSFFSVITDPAGAENIAKISEAIVAIPARKNIEFASSMAALAAANTAAGARTLVTAASQTITGTNQNTSMTPAAATPYEVTINVMLDRDKLASVVQEINGNQAKQAIQGRR